MPKMIPFCLMIIGKFRNPMPIIELMRRKKTVANGSGNLIYKILKDILNVDDIKFQVKKWF